MCCAASADSQPEERPACKKALQTDRLGPPKRTIRLLANPALGFSVHAPAGGMNMSIKYTLWKKRTEFRFRKDECFHIDNLGSANPHELKFGIPNAFCDMATAAIGKTDVLKGDWDRLERRLASDGHAESDDVQSESPVTLAIGRDGDPIVVTGEQQLIRLDTATNEIPVRIAFVHPQWQRFRNQVLNFAGAHRNVVYQKIHHPDLIRAPYGHGDERLELIAPHMPITNGTVLDIGANWGYWSHVMTRLGLKCTAVDHNSKNALFIKRLRRAMNRSFEFIESSIFDLPGPLTYDLILGLNIFHHFIEHRVESQSADNIILFIFIRMFPIHQRIFKTNFPLFTFL